MADLDFRKRAVSALTTAPGVYVLCDLDGVPIYVGQSAGEGIRQRVQPHLTSARSDVVANRQFDVWEVAYVWGPSPVEGKGAAKRLESVLYHRFHSPSSRLMYGKIPPRGEGTEVPEPAEQVQVMPDDEIEQKRDLSQRRPRRAAHYEQIVNHFIHVKKFGRSRSRHERASSEAEKIPLVAVRTVEPEPDRGTGQPEPTEIDAQPMQQLRHRESVAPALRSTVISCLLDITRLIIR